MNNKISGTQILFFILAFILGTFVILKIVSRGNVATAVINNHRIRIEIADTQDKRVSGLSGRNNMALDSGMLFRFDKPGNYSFWMKDMKFSLDFVFIASGKIVDLMENIPYPQSKESPVITVSSKSEFDSVLEINSGVIKEYNIKVGDQVSLVF